MAHAPSGRPPLALTWLLGVVAIAIVAGIVALWPGPVDPPEGADLLRRGAIVDGTVTTVRLGPCGEDLGPGPTDPAVPLCRAVTATIDSGPDAGTLTRFDFPDLATSPDLQPGQSIKLERPPQDIPGVPYAFFDQVRAPSLWWLAVLFAGLVILLGRMRGVAALVGLGLSIAVIMVFILPAILDGESPVLVASVGAGAIAFIVLYLAHGFTSLTSVALAGALAGIAITLVLSIIWVPMAHLAGLASEGSYVIQAVGAEIDLSGLLLAGIVIGALGAVDDVTVTQASAVWELKAADPSTDHRRLFSAGMRVGRDHVGSIVNTLALAYAGASLPLLILFQLSRQSFGSLVGSEVVATEIVRTLVGSIGLVAAMPITTWLAARVAAREAVADEDPHPMPA